MGQVAGEAAARLGAEQLVDQSQQGRLRQHLVGREVAEAPAQVAAHDAGVVGRRWQPQEVVAQVLVGQWGVRRDREDQPGVRGDQRRVQALQDPAVQVQDPADQRVVYEAG